jgi:hypothetical protein
MAKQSSANTIYIKGSPRRLATVLRLPDRAARATTCTVDLPGVKAHRVRIRPIKNTRSDASLLKIKLPYDTPPGVYKGTVHLDDTELPITVDIEVQHGLQIFPTNLKAELRRGQSLRQTISILNGGNSTVELANEYRFCVFDSTGIDRAFFLALASDETKGSKRLDRFLDELADSHGGRVRVEVPSGPYLIKPGEMIEVEVLFHFSDRLHAGRDYAGTLTLENAALHVEIRMSETRKGQS